MNERLREQDRVNPSKIGVRDKERANVICAIHQPQYLPWIGYFDKMDAADIFIYYDNTQYKKNEWQNRNRIKGPNGPQWLTVPVSFEFGQTIREVCPTPGTAWQRKHWQSIATCYGRAPFFEQYEARLKNLYTNSWSNLAELNVAFVEFLKKQIGIDTKTLYASSLSFAGKSTQALVEMCKAVGADTYLSGAGGRNYLEPHLFEEAGVELKFQEFYHPIYPQLYGEFVSHLSILDMLMNCGPSTLERIRACNPR